MNISVKSCTAVRILLSESNMEFSAYMTMFSQHPLFIVKATIWAVHQMRR